MGFYQDQILPRVIDKALDGREPREMRGRVASGLTGQVLEIGFGSGLNVPHYPADVTGVIAIDPSVVGRRLAAERVERSPVPVTYAGLDGQHLPVEDESVDHVLSTWTLCTIPDVSLALSEIARVLRPGGAMHFLEHGRSPDPKVARWQERFNPIQHRIGGGCNLNRPIDELVAASGLRLDSLSNYYWGRPKFMGYMYEGQAVRADGG